MRLKAKNGLKRTKAQGVSFLVRHAAKPHALRALRAAFVPSLEIPEK
jgi:hypothetical protein